MRCPSCNKFVSNEEQDPEEQELRIDLESVATHPKAPDTKEIRISGEVRIVNACVECGEELAEAVFQIDLGMQIPVEHDGEKHELEVSLDGLERVSKTEGKGRGTKTFYGAEGTLTVMCECGELEGVAELWSDYIQASDMDQLT